MPGRELLADGGRGRGIKAVRSELSVGVVLDACEGRRVLVETGFIRSQFTHTTCNDPEPCRLGQIGCQGQRLRVRVVQSAVNVYLMERQPGLLVGGAVGGKREHCVPGGTGAWDLLALGGSISSVNAKVNQ